MKKMYFSKISLYFSTGFEGINDDTVLDFSSFSSSYFFLPNAVDCIQLTFLRNLNN